jgi:hypothetical protein
MLSTEGVMSSSCTRDPVPLGDRSPFTFAIHVEAGGRMTGVLKVDGWLTVISGATAGDGRWLCGSGAMGTDSNVDVVGAGVNCYSSDSEADSICYASLGPVLIFSSTEPF